MDREGKRVLSIRNLPFTVDDSCQKLASYLDISKRYHLSIDDDDDDDDDRKEVEDSKELVKGLPGQVFLLGKFWSLRLVVVVVVCYCVVVIFFFFF